jgi:3-oxoacyl-[acyl-carrier-protein] synthase-3
MDHPSDYSARMDGQAVIVHALRKIIEACQNLLKRNGLTIDDVRWIVPHQANANLLKQIARGLRFESADRQVILILEDYGNTSSASMGMSLDVLRRSGQLKSGDYLLLPAFGAGFTWGAALCLSE